MNFICRLYDYSLQGRCTRLICTKRGCVMLRKLSVLLVALVCARASAAQNPTPVQGDFVLKNFQFTSGEMLPELRVHYRTFGKPQRDAQGIVRNAVLIMHGTTGSGASLINPEFAGQLFGPAGLLDAERYFLIIPDGIGHGQSSKPSDGLRGGFPHYGYLDMVEAQYRLLTEGLRVDHLRLGERQGSCRRRHAVSNSRLVGSGFEDHESDGRPVSGLAGPSFWPAAPGAD